MRGDGRAANRIVSTHSRPKAAGAVMMFVRDSCNGFNSQPPEGGWVDDLRHWLYSVSFNSQPPEGGWRQRVAGLQRPNSFNSQPPEGGWMAAKRAKKREQVSTHSRPKAAGQALLA